MAFRALLVVCASALFVQTAYSQCAAGFAGPYGLVGFGGFNGLAGGYDAGLAGGYGPGLVGGYGAGCGCGAGVASTGGGLPVSSVSPIAPVGVSVISENAYEGTLSAGGNLPFLGSVGIQGVLPTAGTGAVSYGCGNGVFGIGSEGPIATGITVPGAVFPPSSPNSAATNDALALVGSGLSYNGLGYNGLSYNGQGYNGLSCNGQGYNGLGYNGLGGNAGYGLEGASYNGVGGMGCGCGAIY